LNSFYLATLLVEWRDTRWLMTDNEHHLRATLIILIIS